MPVSITFDVIQSVPHFLFCGRCNTGEFGVGARSFTDKILCRRVGRAWRGLAAAAGAVAHGTAVPKRGILQPR